MPCNATAKARVDAAKSIPMDWMSVSRGNPVACRKRTPGTTNDPVMPVRIPFTVPIAGPA
jgi:hypothetical protein